VDKDVNQFARIAAVALTKASMPKLCANGVFSFGNGRKYCPGLAKRSRMSVGSITIERLMVVAKSIEEVGLGTVFRLRWGLPVKVTLAACSRAVLPALFAPVTMLKPRVSSSGEDSVKLL
jgi:hypothetical protein